MNFSAVAIPFMISFFAGASTLLGGLIYLSNKFNGKKHFNFFLGLSAGVMIYLSFVELLTEAITKIGAFKANVYFFLGILIIAAIDTFLPYHIFEKRFCRRLRIADTRLLYSGLFTTLALFIHNFPEGMAVFLSSYVNIKFGFLFALAIAIHNIPEGIAVAAPIYHSTLSKSKAMIFTFISGIAEPIGAIFGYLILKPYINNNTLAYIFAFVAGIMVYISFDELLPTCFRNGYNHKAIAGIISGMILVALSLLLL